MSPQIRVGRVARGGNWNNDAAYCRAARRYNDDPGDAYGSLGFRCVRTVRAWLARSYRVSRGGGWNNVVAAIFIARARLKVAPSVHDHSLGFRCMRRRE